MIDVTALVAFLTEVMAHGHFVPTTLTTIDLHTTLEAVMLATTATMTITHVVMKDMTDNVRVPSVQMEVVTMKKKEAGVLAIERAITIRSAVVMEEAAVVLEMKVALVQVSLLGLDTRRTVLLNINYFNVSIDSALREIFKYHVTVERTASSLRYGASSGDHQDGAPSAVGDDTGASETTRQDHQNDVASGARDSTGASEITTQEPRPTRPLQRSLVRDVINAALRKFGEEFAGVRVVHDGMSALYSPVILPWSSKEFADVDLGGVGVNSFVTPSEGAVSASRRRGPRTFVVKVNLVETISLSTLEDFYSDAMVNVMPVLQALDVVVRHLAAQRLVAVGSEFYSLKKTHTLNAGKELCWGYHQAIHAAERKLLVNVDQATTVFYSPGPLMRLVTAALRVRSPREVQRLSDRQLKELARALRDVEVIPTHRKDCKRAICGVSALSPHQIFMNAKGKEISIAGYFSERYGKQLEYPSLPLVNVGSKRPGKETWLPIELCTVAPGQHCASSEDVDAPEITRLTSQPPQTRQANILEHVRQARFEHDPFLEAFGMKVEQRLQRIEARVMDGPHVQYQNVSVHRSDGQWSLNDKTFVKGVRVRNWGVIVLADVWNNEVRKFLQTLCEVGNGHGLPFENTRPEFVHQSENRGVGVDELMTKCFRQLEKCQAERRAGPPQLLLVILPDTSSFLYGDVKRTSDTVLGIASQCIASKNLRKANAAFCANVCLKINMRLNGKNAVLRGPLPLISTAPTILVGADVEYPRPSSDYQPAIAAVVASMDAYSAQYAARVAAQKTSSEIQRLPHMLRELFLAYFENTKRRPEHVMYYRGGVGKGEMVDILQAELRALRMAFKMISENYSPLVTFIVANKRHHTRAFPVSPRDGDRKGNVKPGTVVDAGVVDPHRFEFFLWGHTSLQGTSKPCRYTVLHDENNMSAGDVQQLTYHLGYTFSRSTHSVSVVTPVYYANEAAAHARHFLREEPSGESTDGTSQITFSFAKVHPNVLNRMFFI
ncbi:hypothetical protein PRIC1_013582 [Phytophthora ramorum]